MLQRKGIRVATRFKDFISTLRHMKMCNMKSYYMYKYKEKHEQMNMGFTMAKYRNSIKQYILVHLRLMTKRFLWEQEKHNLEKKTQVYW